MKRLLCAVLLTCAYASAQQINPNQIQPSLTNGYVLTTVSGAAVWAPSSGGCGATGSANEVMVFTGTDACSGDQYLEDFAITSSGTGFLQSTSNGAQFSNSLGGSYKFVLTGNGGAYDNGSDFVFDAEETGTHQPTPADFEVALEDDTGNNDSAEFLISTSGTTGSNTGQIDLSALCTSGPSCGNVNLSAQSSGGAHTGQVNINAYSSGSGTDSGAVLISSSGGSGALGGAISLAAGTTVQLYGQTTGIGVEIGAMQTMIQNPTNNGYGTIDTSPLQSADTWDYSLPRLTGTFTLYTGTLTPNDCVIINGTGTGIVDAGTSSCNGGGGGGSAFSAITSGTNTAATMTVGTGGTLTFSGTGVNNASEINGVTVTGTASSGKAIVATSSSAADWQAIPSGVTWPASGDLVISNTTNTPVGLAPVNGDCVIGSGGAWTAGTCGGTVYPSSGVANSTGSAWGTSYQVGTAANDLVQLNASAQLPAVSGVNLTNLNGSNIASGTVGSAYLPLGSSSAFGALKCGSGTSCSAGTISVSGGGGLTGSGTADYYALWTGTTALGNGHVDDGVTTAGTITSSEPVTVDATTQPSEITLTYNSGHAPSGASGSAVIAPDTSGNFDVSENGGSFARVCTATNGECSTGSGFPITLGSTSIAASSTTTSVSGLEVNGVTLSASGSANDFLNEAGSYAVPFTLTTTGSSGAATFSGGTLNIPQYSGGGSSAFNSITTGTNTTATMTVGSGGTLTVSGSGVNNANEVNGATVPASEVALASNSSSQIVAATVNGSGAGLTTGPASSTSGDVADFTGTSGQIADSGVLLSSLQPQGTVTYTSAQTASSSDNGKLVIMNCSSACAYTLPTSQPSTTWHAWVSSQGSTLATITLGGSDTFNGSASVPALNSYRLLGVWANTATSTDYRGDAPLVAGTNVTFTAASNGLTVAASGGGGGSVSITSSTSDLTVSPSPLTGTGTIDLNLAHANTWTGNITMGSGATVTFDGSTSGSCTLSVTATAGTLELCGTSAEVTSAGAYNGTTLANNGSNVLEVGGTFTNTGTDNTMIGNTLSAGGSSVNVGYDITTGSDSVAVGALENASGSNSVAIGSGSSGCSGNNCVMIGTNAGGWTTAFTGTTAVGEGALHTENCTDCTVVGYESTANAATYSNLNILGYNITGTASNETIVGNSSITLTILRGLTQFPAWQSTGTAFTVSGCGTPTATGGAAAGTFAAGSSTCNPVITPGYTAANGWTCTLHDETTSGASFRQTAHSATTATFAGTSVSSSDVIDAMCIAF